MKLAITYDNGQVFQHFGRSAQFKFYEAENGQLLRTEVIPTNGQATAHWRAFSYSMAQTSCSAAASAPGRRWR